MALGVIPQVAAWGASAYGQFAQAEGQRSTNAANIGMAERANESNERMARENREWQQFMSNTSMRRQVRDYERAGINPLLGVGQGASTPTGSVSTASPAKVDNPMSGFMASAQELANQMITLRKQKGELELMNKQGKLTDSQAAKAKAEAELIRTEIPKGKVQGGFWDKVYQSLDSAAKNNVSTPESRSRESLKIHQNRVKQKGLK